jgi:tRNA (mo5U34)-methyltransferase
MDARELEERIARFPRWQYRFEFDDGVATPVSDRGQVNRQEQRRRYFFDALLGVTGGSLGGHRILDLGCNAGFWSLAAIEAGADFVLGIDFRETFIYQANLVFEAKGIDPSRYRFEQGNVFEHDLGGQDSGARFDIVLCLGLMEQVAKPVELFELIAHAGAEIVVIDTIVSRARSSFFEVSRLNNPSNAVEYEMVLIPTREAVVELAGQFGFQTVPLAQQISDWLGMSDYRRDRRLAFICSKSLPLDGLPAAKPSTLKCSWSTMLDPRRALPGPRR